jgi:hypothetical protein
LGRIISIFNTTTMWQQWTNLLLGLWVIISPYLFDDQSALLTNITISGVIIAGLALWGALEHRTYHMPNNRQQRHA